MPDGCTMSWTATSDNGNSSDMFTVLTGNSLDFSTAAQPNAQGFGTITLTFNSPGNPEKIITKKVWVGSPSAIDITTDGSFNFTGNNTSICTTFGYCMTATNPQVTVGSPPTTSFSTTNYSYSGSFPNANGSNAFFTPSTSSVTNDRVCFGSNIANTYTVNVTAINECGINSRLLFVTVNNCGYRVFPNPAKETVKIEFERPDKPESIPDLIEIYDEKKQKKSKTIDFSKNKKSILEINVSDLERGVYYLKLTYEKKREVETIRLILE